MQSRLVRVPYGKADFGQSSFQSIKVLHTGRLDSREYKTNIKILIYMYFRHYESTRWVRAKETATGHENQIFQSIKVLHTDRLDSREYKTNIKIFVSMYFRQNENTCWARAKEMAAGHENQIFQPHAVEI